MTDFHHTKPDDQWPCPRVSYDFDLAVTFDLCAEVKNGISLKMLLLTQTTCDGNMVWSPDLTNRVLMAKGSKVILKVFESHKL